MASKADLRDWVLEAIKSHHGEASVIDVAKHIWTEHGQELQSSGDLFYTWQYDMRWAAQDLRRERKLALAPNRKWALAKMGR